MVDGGMRLDDAIAAPRIHIEGADKPNVDFEDRFRGDHRKELLSAFPKQRPGRANRCSLVAFMPYDVKRAAAWKPPVTPDGRA